MGILTGIAFVVVFAIVVGLIVLSKKTGKARPEHPAGKLGRPSKPLTEPGRTGDLD